MVGSIQTQSFGPNQFNDRVSTNTRIDYPLSGWDYTLHRKTFFEVDMKRHCIQTVPFSEPIESSLALGYTFGYIWYTYLVTSLVTQSQLYKGI